MKTTIAIPSTKGQRKTAAPKVAVGRLVDMLPRWTLGRKDGRVLLTLDGTDSVLKTNYTDALAHLAEYVRYGVTNPQEVRRAAGWHGAVPTTWSTSAKCYIDRGSMWEADALHWFTLLENDA